MSVWSCNSRHYYDNALRSHMLIVPGCEESTDIFGQFEPGTFQPICFRYAEPGRGESSTEITPVSVTRINNAIELEQWWDLQKVFWCNEDEYHPFDGLLSGQWHVLKEYIKKVQPTGFQYHTPFIYIVKF